MCAFRVLMEIDGKLGDGRVAFEEEMGLAEDEHINEDLQTLGVRRAMGAVQENVSLGAEHRVLLEEDVPVSRFGRRRVRGVVGRQKNDAAAL